MSRLSCVPLPTTAFQRVSTAASSTCSPVQSPSMICTNGFARCINISVQRMPIERVTSSKEDPSPRKSWRLVRLSRKRRRSKRRTWMMQVRVAPKHASNAKRRNLKTCSTKSQAAAKNAARQLLSTEFSKNNSRLLPGFIKSYSMCLTCTATELACNIPSDLENPLLTSSWIGQQTRDYVSSLRHQDVPPSKMLSIGMKILSVCSSST